MGEKKGKKNDNGGEKTKPKDKAGEDGSLMVVLKVDMHCEGCARKVKRSVDGFEGVESVDADNESSKLTVVGKVDPWKLRERVEQKTHKKVTLISPTDYPKEKKVDKQEKGDIKQKKISDEPRPKPKPPVASTVVLNILLHCEGCIQRIRRSISKVKGVDEVLFDAPKDLVIVKGIMDVKSMVPFLQNKFKRKIVIIQAAAKKDDGDKKNDKAKENIKDKDKEGDDDAKKDKVNSDEKKNGKDMSGGGEKKGKKGTNGGGGEKKEKKEKKDGGGEKEKQDGGGEKKDKKDGGGEKKEKKNGDGGEKEKKDGVGGEGKMESSKMEYYSGGYVPYEQHYYHHQPYQQYQQYQFPQQQQQQYHHHQQQYYPAMADMAHAPQMFSDENPNACSIM